MFRRPIVRGLVAAAATVVLAVTSWAILRPTMRLEDVDRSGRVDVLDAYLVAKALDGGGEVPARYDVTSDGVVNDADIARIMDASVALERS